MSDTNAELDVLNEKWANEFRQPLHDDAIEQRVLAAMEKGMTRCEAEQFIALEIRYSLEEVEPQLPDNVIPFPSPPNKSEDTP